MTLIRIWVALLLWLPSFIFPQQTQPVVTPDQLIQAVNALRTAKGLPALRANAILMGTAQYAADLLADSQTSGQLGVLKDRIIAAGYGSGYPSASISAVEDYAISSGSDSAAQIVSKSWSDEAHMIPMTRANYCDVGAGVSQAADGSYYYVLHAAYNSDVPCGAAPATAVPGKPTLPPTPSDPHWIVPIVHSTPDNQGRIIHIVQQGQTLWYIAISYGTKIIAIQQLNGMSADDKTLYNGEKLLIPTSLTPLPTLTPSRQPGAVLQATATPLPSPRLPEGTLAPSPTPTIDPNEQAVVDERFRGGLFIALAISMVLIVAGLLVSRR